MKNTVINNIDEFEKFAINFSNKIRMGMVISLEGDLGAGKTTFVQGLLKGFNYKNDVTSPTFTLINEYNADFKVIHIDFYREPNINRWKHLGLHEFMNNHHIILIEWGNLIPELLPEDTIHIFFEHVDNNKRKIIYNNENFSN